MARLNPPAPPYTFPGLHFLFEIAMTSLFSQILFWSAAACCVAAQAIILRATLSGRTPGAPRTGGRAPRRAGELAWTSLPAIALALLLVVTWQAVRTRHAGAPSAAFGAVSAAE